MYTYVRLYRSIYIVYQSVSIVYDDTYFISKVYTVINRHIPQYTVIYNILVYTSIRKDIFSYFDIYEYIKRYHEISFHILTYTSICNDVVRHHIASYISIFPYDILVYQSILEVQRFQMYGSDASASHHSCFTGTSSSLILNCKIVFTHWQGEFAINCSILATPYADFKSV